ncbi:sodium-dependent organic anion transporter isoform X1 [Peromyscus maniculatus bairdii]|uniref:sodium-dependent organic anion transporter isoform X1 n=1 Tax=Peromyscus maniculatus bairdii TaxID=230844 RepID=UPI003FD33762
MRSDECGLFRQLRLPCQQHGGGAAGGNREPWDPEARFHGGVSRDGGSGHVLLWMFCGDSEAVVTPEKTLGHRSGTALPVWTHAPDSLSAGHWLLSEAIPSDGCPHHGVLPWGHHLKCSHLLGGRRYGSQHQYDNLFHGGCSGNDAPLPLPLHLVLELYTESHHSIPEHRSVWGLGKSGENNGDCAGITLASLIVPVAFGVYMNYRWPKQAKVVLKVGAIAGGILLLVVAVTGVVLAKGWNTDVTLLIISFIFPLVGHVTGFLLAFLTHQSWQRCRTISIETGAQNIQLCIAMLQLSFTAEYLVQLFNFALAYGLFQVLHGLFIVAAYQVYKRRQKRKHRRQHPDCPDVCYEKRPRETSAFLEEGDEAAVTLGPSEPGQQHRAAE